LARSYGGSVRWSWRINRTAVWFKSRLGESILLAAIRGIASAILIGAFAGLMPAVRASRMPPTVALRTV
jgi:hypothetical protein